MGRTLEVECIVDENNNWNSLLKDGVSNFEATPFGSRTDSQIQEFYSQGSVFITGGTGFIGKALVEKLLRTCPSLQSIYLLIRPKKGCSVQERCKELLQNPVFDLIRSGDEDCGSTLLSKVIGVEGDVSLPDLGMSEVDREMLLREVNVVFHSAATVRFNETLETAVILNTLGTQRVLYLCRKMKKLKSLVHVSTAYSNADKQEVLEMVYGFPDNSLVSRMDVLVDEKFSQKIFMDMGKKLQAIHPNTYTITKAMAEWVVAENSDTLPIAIVRPSIVTAAWREPYSGWVDSVSGITGIMMEIGRGTMRSIICEQHLVVDIVPVDIVVNTLVASAWHTATYRPSAVRVYNCTSGTLNPLRWEELGAFTQKHALSTPSQYTMWYPGFTFRTNRFLHLLCEKLFHYLPAFAMDAVLRFSGSKPVMVKIYKKFKLAAQTGEFFALHQWNFACGNIHLLQQSIEYPSDKETFFVDISRVDWDTYIRNYMLGIRQFILKDNPQTIERAQKKLKRLYWLHRFVQIFSAVLILKIIRR